MTLLNAYYYLTFSFYYDLYWWVVLTRSYIMYSVDRDYNIVLIMFYWNDRHYIIIINPLQIPQSNSILYIIYTAGRNRYCAQIEFEQNQYLLALSNRYKYVHRDRYSDYFHKNRVTTTAYCVWVPINNKILILCKVKPMLHAMLLFGFDCTVG